MRVRGHGKCSFAVGAPRRALGNLLRSQPQHSVTPTSPGMPPGKSRIWALSRYPRGRICFSQKPYSSWGRPVRDFSQPASAWLMARPRSVQSSLGKRRTRTSVWPFASARWMIAAARSHAPHRRHPRVLTILRAASSSPPPRRRRGGRIWQLSRPPPAPAPSAGPWWSAARLLVIIARSIHLRMRRDAVAARAIQLSEQTTTRR